MNLSRQQEMGHPYQLNHNSDTQHGLTQVSSPVSNPASIRLMSAWLCYPLNRHIEVYHQIRRLSGSSLQGRML